MSVFGKVLVLAGVACALATPLHAQVLGMNPRPDVAVSYGYERRFAKKIKMTTEHSRTSEIHCLRRDRFFDCSDASGRSSASKIPSSSNNSE
jgi:hypothetical protein